MPESVTPFTTGPKFVNLGAVRTIMQPPRLVTYPVGVVPLAPVGAGPAPSPSAPANPIDWTKLGILAAVAGAVVFVVAGKKKKRK